MVERLSCGVLPDPGAFLVVFIAAVLAMAGRGLEKVFSNARRFVFISAWD
jgi:hypothetical protein